MLEYKSSKRFKQKTSNFAEEIYRIDDESTHLFKYVYTLLELGIGQLSLWQDEATDSESLPGTKYTDLDALFGFLGITRLPPEIYDFDPYIQQLTSWQWNEVHAKDALFRLRIMRFFQALLRGGTAEGVKMMAECASGVECQVIEMWRVVSGSGLASGFSIGRSPALGMAKEFVVIPLETINDDQRSAMIYLIDVLKPINTLCTIRMTPSIVLEEVDLIGSSSDSYFFEVRKMVSANDNILFRDPDIWIQPGLEVEGPTFAGMSTHDAEWSLNGAATAVNAYIIDDTFSVPFATLVGAINSSVTSLVADESLAPSVPSFSIMVDDEEIFVSDRVPVVGQDTQYTYTVSRAQNGTVAASHSNAADVNSGILKILPERDAVSELFGPWQDIPLADSSDNYEEGRFVGDPTKYDESGNYIFEYSSQGAYIAWFSRQIESLGGEISGTRYRLPVAVDQLAGTESAPGDALAQIALSIQTRLFPDRFQ